MQNRLCIYQGENDGAHPEHRIFRICCGCVIDRANQCGARISLRADAPGFLYLVA